MLNVLETDLAKTHLSLHVNDLGASVEFYRVLFGIEPTKRYADYAKFELHDPPVVFSIQPGPRQAGASLSHLGLRLTKYEAVEQIQKRLEDAGVSTSRQDNVVCGYAKQSKIWAADPDGNYWEIYVLDEDVSPESVHACLTQLVPTDGVAAGGSVWEHRWPATIPASISHADQSLDDVRLEGTLNAVEDAAKTALLDEVARVLRSGGQLNARCLVTSHSARPQELPRWAQEYPVLPTPADVVAALTGAGFVGIRITEPEGAHRWASDDVELREIQVQAFQPSTASNAVVDLTVLYLGPFREAVDFAGNVYPRGERVPVSQKTWNELRRGEFAEQFLFAVPDATGTCGGDQ